MIAFDTLEYSNELVSVGMPREQAEVQARTLKKIIDNDLATKTDVLRLENQIEQTKAELKRDIEVTHQRIEETKAELKRDIEQTKAELKRDLKEIEMKLTIRLGGLMMIGVGTVATLVKLL